MVFNSSTSHSVAAPKNLLMGGGYLNCNAAVRSDAFMSASNRMGKHLP